MGQIDEGNFFGLYELDDEGNIRYSRHSNEVGTLSDRPSEEIVGMNLFHDVAKFENREVLRSRFKDFIAGSKPAENFSFDLIEGSKTIRSAIQMTRALEADAAERYEIVILNIKRA
jgi:hypothetical protein